MLAGDENLIGLMAVNRELIAQAEAQVDSECVVLDMDSTESSVHGQQESSAYNGHFESACYHPLLLFNQHGDCLAAKLRPGNVSSAEGWDDLLLPEVKRQQAEGKQVTFRADAAFAKPEIYKTLEERGVDYVIRIPANKNLELEVEGILFRPPDRPSRKPLVPGRTASTDSARLPWERGIGQISQYTVISNLADPTASNTLGGAVRAERFADFGSTLNYKLVERIDVADGFGLRGGASSGFRACIQRFDHLRYLTGRSHQPRHDSAHICRRYVRGRQASRAGAVAQLHWGRHPGEGTVQLHCRLLPHRSDGPDLVF